MFTVHENAAGNGIEFRYKTSGSIASTPTFTGTGSTHTITNPTVGVSVLTPVSGVAAEYNVSATGSETTTLKVSDGNTTVSVASATYSTISAQVTAIQSASDYENLKFTVSVNDAGNGFKFSYKKTGAVATAPTLTGTGSSHSVTANTTGVTAVNSASVTTINVTTDTPNGVVNAINSADTGVTATLIDTGIGNNTFKIMLSGQTGSNGVFTLTSTPDLGFHDTANLMQSAQDSIFEYEGVSIIRSSNQMTDVIEGATIDLLATTASDVTLTISNDRSKLKTSIADMVTAYNDIGTLLDNFTDTDSEAELSGALSGDTSLVRFLNDKIRSAMFADSSTPSGSVTSLRSLGLSVDQYGKMSLNEIKYDSAILENYSDVVTMLTADTNNQNLYESASKGLAQDIATILDDFTDSSGILSTREKTTNEELSDHQDSLLKLETRMDAVYSRYLQQFGAMETLMATLDSTRDYLTSQFETLSKAYDVD